MPNITLAVTTEDFAAEGIETVVERLSEIMKVDATLINPMMFVETGRTKDIRLPPLDIDGDYRELERPLWGKHVLYGRRYYPFTIDESLFQETVHRPETDESGREQMTAIMAALRETGVKVLVHQHPWKLPNADSSVLPEDVFGKRAPLALSENLCPNKQEVVSYAEALARQLLRSLTPDGLSVDWLEYTNYRFEDNLKCFCPECRREMQIEGFDDQKIVRAAQEVYESIRSMNPKAVDKPDSWKEAWSLLSSDISLLFEFKATTVDRMAQRIESLVREELGSNVELRFSGFAFPMCIGSGLDYPRLLGHTQMAHVETKMYRFHWGLMVRWYSEDLSRIHGFSTPEDWVPFVKGLLEVDDASDQLETFRMPKPNERGPVSVETERRKLEQAYSWVDSLYDRLTTRIHMYGPIEVIDERLKIAQDLGLADLGIQRYGYMSDAKMSLLASRLKGGA